MRERTFLQKSKSAVPPHGGDLYEFTTTPDAATPFSCTNPLLDFSANISPLGLPEGVRSALTDRAPEFVNYPDPYCRELRAALASKHIIPQEHIVCGAGSADLIFRIARAILSDAKALYYQETNVDSTITSKQVPTQKTALVTAPAFSEYERAATQAGAKVVFHPLAAPGFEVNEDFIAGIKNMSSGKTTAFICNPNNPTGVLTPVKTIEHILEACKKTGTTLILDECFMDLVDEPKKYSAEPLLKNHENLIILKAFTKTYAMAGLRLGYALCGDPETAETISETGPPWSVSVPAQIAGVQALKEEKYYQKLRELIKTERTRLMAAIAGMSIIYTEGSGDSADASPILGSANYLFFRTKKEIAKSLVPDLRKQGIAIRDCSNFNGLEDGTYFRIAVRLPEENDRLLSALKTAEHSANGRHTKRTR